MPRLKEPSSLEDLALQSLGKNVWRACQKAIDAIASGRTAEIKIGDLHQYLYADLPHFLSCKVSAHMLEEIFRRVRRLTYDDRENTDVKIIFEHIVLGCVYPHITVLNMAYLVIDAETILTWNIHTFKKLHTLNCSGFLPTDAIERLPIVLSHLNFLVKFVMQRGCTDAIIQTLGSWCSTTIELLNVEYSERVTDASFKNFMKCHKLKRLLIRGTSVTNAGYAIFLQSIRQNENSDDTPKGFLHISVGSKIGWDISSTPPNEIATTFPMLKQLEIQHICGDMEALVSLTTLEVLNIYDSNLYRCNLSGFLRVRGSNLISLKLEYTDLVDLTCIMNNCINLKELFVTEGSIVDTVLENTENAAKACQNLEIIYLRSEFSASVIERMLYACVNIKDLRLFSNYEITDEFILRLLSKNSLLKLTSFTVRSTELSMQTANAVIEHCPLLEEVQYEYAVTVYPDYPLEEVQYEYAMTTYPGIICVGFRCF